MTSLQTNRGDRRGHELLKPISEERSSSAHAALRVLLVAVSICVAASASAQDIGWPGTAYDPGIEQVILKIAQ